MWLFYTHAASVMLSTEYAASQSTTHAETTMHLLEDK